MTSFEKSVNQFASVVIIFALVGLYVNGGLEWALQFLAIAFVVPAATVIIHEFGHLLAGWLVGWRLVIFNALGVSLHWQHRRLYLGQPEMMRDAGGWVLMTPRDQDSFTPLRSAVMSTGGPLASLLQVLASIYFGLAYPLAVTELGRIPNPWSIGFAVFGILSLGVTIWPSRSGLVSDGATIIDDLKAWRRGEMLSALGWTGQLLNYKVRLRDVPRWLLDEIRPDEHPGWERDVLRYLDSVAIGRALDARNVDAPKAMRLMSDFERRYGANDWLRCCRAYCQAFHLRDLGGAKATMLAAGSPSTIPQMDFAAKAAIAMLEGDKASGIDLLAKMDAAIAATSPFADPTFRDIRRQVLSIEASQP